MAAAHRPPMSTEVGGWVALNGVAGHVIVRASEVSMLIEPEVLGHDDHKLSVVTKSGIVAYLKEGDVLHVLQRLEHAEALELTVRTNARRIGRGLKPYGAKAEE